MEATLGCDTKVSFHISNSSIKVIRLLHKVVFGVDGDSKKVRSNLKQFKGFPFLVGSDEYNQKLMEIKKILPLPDMITICHILDCDYEGDEDEVAERITSYLTTLCKRKVSELEDDEDGSDCEEDNSSYTNNKPEREEIESLSLKTSSQCNLAGVDEATKVCCNRGYQDRAFSLNIRDIEDTVRSFDGDASFPVEKWISDFEELAMLTGWNELQKLLFAKNLLRGTARLFVQSERNVTSWMKLKNLLIEKFERKTSAALIHEMLTNRKKGSNESVQDYEIIMKEIGSRGNVDWDSIMHYVIKGITDRSPNKIILYGAKTPKEFEEKLKLYAELCATSNESKLSFKEVGKSIDNSRDTASHEVNQEYPFKCYACGQLGHKANFCPSKGRGPKCYRCNKFGHISRSCDLPMTSESSQSLQEFNEKDVGIINIVENRAEEEEEMMKTVTIGGITFQALIDTGSDVNLMTVSSCFKIIKYVEYVDRKVVLKGLGGHVMESLGEISMSMTIDGKEFSIDCCIVPDDLIKYDVLIGKHFLRNVGVSIVKGVVKIKVEEFENPLAEVNIIESREVVVGENCSVDSKNKILTLVDEYNPTGKETTDIVTKIIVKDELPIHQGPRRLAYSEVEEVNKHVDEWLSKGIIRPSNSEFTSPVVHVKKEDGPSRLCVDFHKLNPKVIKDRYPLPLIEERNELRRFAKGNILNIQNENKRTYNLRRKKPYPYKVGDVVAIKRTQFGQQNKLESKPLGRYKILRRQPNDRYEEEKVGDGIGSRITSASVVNVKPWPVSFGANDGQEGRFVGYNSDEELVGNTGLV